MNSHKRTNVLMAKSGVAAIGIASLVALAGCSSASPDAAPGEAAGCDNITFLINNMANPWIATLADGAVAQAAELGANLTVQDGANDNATQIAQLQQAVANGTSGILIQSIEADGIVPAVQQANAAGIPVVAVNANVGDGAELVTYVGVDQSDYGVGLAQLAEQAIPDGGKVALIQGIVGNPVEVLRTEAFVETIGKNPAIEIVATVTDNWSNDENLAVVQDLLTKFGPGELDVIVAEGPEIYIGAQYAHSIGRDDVKFVAGDFPNQVHAGIESGEVYGAVLQDGAEQGKAGITALCSWLEGNEDAVKRPTDFVELPLVTKENLSEFSTSWDW
ncbi:sugar ABC transporter substrate-binding protein [Salinibacterium sp. G-O1]|uniref:sugar ABC transporter substrate-binding protein n=1 Tax=Salinibacterium sp. G-O1 TaxID=3046208 RepID=UPI0024B9C20B|nr:sugar ABC transporter substrate-binding protein [Salinibacterium sp. G-O1]MDJ0334174.1 sugar ABC transporter substrate-binding protein [Salinibacterium sp. G-O1]